MERLHWSRLCYCHMGNIFSYVIATSTDGYKTVLSMYELTDVNVNEAGNYFLASGQDPHTSGVLDMLSLSNGSSGIRSVITADVNNGRWGKTCPASRSMRFRCRPAFSSLLPGNPWPLRAAKADWQIRSREEQTARKGLAERPFLVPFLDRLRHLMGRRYKSCHDGEGPVHGECAGKARGCRAAKPALQGRARTWGGYEGDGRMVGNLAAAAGS